MADDEDVLARITPSAPRRVVGFGMLLALGIFLVWTAFQSPPEHLFWQLFLVAAGATALLVAQRFWRATATSLVLTRSVLTEERGGTVARVRDIVSVDRGMLAFKPSNGFVLTLAAGSGSAWAPGLWWRIGRRVGVGGVVSSVESKAMAEVIAALLAERDD